MHSDNIKTSPFITRGGFEAGAHLENEGIIAPFGHIQPASMPFGLRIIKQNRRQANTASKKHRTPC